MCQPANQDARGRFERERHVAALLRGGPRGEMSFCLHGDPGPAPRCGPVTRLGLNDSSLGHCLASSVQARLSRTVIGLKWCCRFLLSQRPETMGSELSSGTVLAK